MDERRQVRIVFDDQCVSRASQRPYSHDRPGRSVRDTPRLRRARDGGERSSRRWWPPRGALERNPPVHEQRSPPVSRPVKPRRPNHAARIVPLASSSTAETIEKRPRNSLDATIVPTAIVLDVSGPIRRRRASALAHDLPDRRRFAPVLIVARIDAARSSGERISIAASFCARTDRRRADRAATMGPRRPADYSLAGRGRHRAHRCERRTRSIVASLPTPTNV